MSPARLSGERTTSQAVQKIDFRLTIDRPVAILPAMDGDADAAVAALTEHFLTTMHLVELAAPRISEASNTV
jgi:hypothetical protein